MINIQNRATSALYRYTPYQPNAGALAAGYGTAPCGAYGNRNFYQYFEDWFGNITGEAKYEAFVYPRYLKLTEDAERVHTYSGAYYDTLKAGTIVKYTSKIFIRDKWYYRTEWATNNGVDIVVPASALVEVAEKYEKMEPVYLELVNDTERINPYTGGYVDTLKAGTTYYMTSKIEMNGVVYYRTEWATNNNADMAIPMSALVSVTKKYQDFQAPRYMRLKRDAERVNPYTNGYVDTLKAGAVLYFTSKIDISGETYYRTKWATDNNADMAILAEDVEEI